MASTKTTVKAKDCDALERSETFDNEILEHMGLLYSVALRMTRNATDAQDLLQDVVVRALRFHHKFKQGTYLKAWLLTILRNTFINDYRKKSRRPMLVEWTGSEKSAVVYNQNMGYYPRELWPEQALELLDDEVRGAMDALPEGHRQAVIMADLQDMTYREIADKLDCPLGTVMSRLHRGRRLMRERLRSYREEMAYT